MRRSVWICGVLVIAACSRPTYLPGPDVVARLGQEELHAGQFESWLHENLGESGAGLASPALSGLFDQFLTEELLLHAARERGLSGERGGRRDLVETLLAAEGPITVSDSEVAAYYAEHQEEARQPERVRLWQLIAPNRVAAERARRELLAGLDPATVLAKARRETPGVDGGPQGELARDELPPAFAAAVFALSDGGVSDVIEADYGFEVFRVEARLPARLLPLAEAAPQIRRELATRKADERFAALVAAARSRYAVTVYDRNLPFEYHGSFPTSRPYEER